MQCTSMCVTCPLLCISLCLRYATSHGIVVVVDKQLRYETYIVPALSINNIAVFLYMCLTLNARLPTPSPWHPCCTQRSTKANVSIKVGKIF